MAKAINVTALLAKSRARSDEVSCDEVASDTVAVVKCLIIKPGYQFRLLHGRRRNRRRQREGRDRRLRQREGRDRRPLPLVRDGEEDRRLPRPREGRDRRRRQREGRVRRPLPLGRDVGEDRGLPRPEKAEIAGLIHRRLPGRQVGREGNLKAAVLHLDVESFSHGREGRDRRRQHHEDEVAPTGKRTAKVAGLGEVQAEFAPAAS